MKSKTKPRYLEGKYAEPNDWLIHAAFESVCQFVECGDMGIVCWYDSDEDIDEHSSQEHVREHRQAKKDILELYEYWKERNHKDFKNKNDPMQAKGVPKLKIETKKIKGSKCSKMRFKCGDGSKGDEKKYKKALDAHIKWEKEFYKKEEIMLIKIVKIRHYLQA